MDARAPQEWLSKVSESDEEMDLAIINEAVRLLQRTHDYFQLLQKSGPFAKDILTSTNSAR